MNARLLIVLMLSAVSVGCSSVRHTATGEPIYFVGTKEYQHKVQTLALTAQQARERVASHVVATLSPPYNDMVAVGKHQVIVGDAFVFAGPEKMGVSLAGYYVDGHTGTVTERDEGLTSHP